MAGLAVRSVDGALLALAFALALTLNFDSFAREPLAIDEHVSFWIADGSSPGTLLTRSFQYSATPPLFFALERMSLSALGQREWALRAPAAASYLAALAVVWWVARRWLSSLSGGMAAMLLAVHPGVASLAVVARPYSLGILLSALAIHATAQLCAAPTKLRWASLFAVNLALIHTHYLFAALWAGEAVWLARSVSARQIQWRHLFIWMATVLICVLTVAPGVWRVWTYRDYLNWTTRQPVLWDLLAVAVPVRASWVEKPLGWALGAVPLLWQVVAGRYRPIDWFDRPRWHASGTFIGWCIIWLALPATGLWLIGRFWLPSIAADRYAIIFAPVVALIWAGLCGLLKGTVAPILGVLVLALWGGTAERVYDTVPLPGGWRALGSDRHGVGVSVSARWKEVAEMIDQRTTSGDLMLVGSGLAEMSLVPVLRDDSTFHDYVSCRLGRMYLHTPVRRLGIPMFWPGDRLGQDLDTFYRLQLVRACRGESTPDRPVAPRIWLVAATDTDVLLASVQHARALLESSGAIEVWSGGYSGLDVVLYECPNAARGL